MIFFGYMNISKIIFRKKNVKKYVIFLQFEFFEVIIYDALPSAEKSQVIINDHLHLDW